MSDNDEVLLKVEHLCQYFPMGGGHELKAVDDVSFDIKKGEVFGLVGESGCGKTTTGRSIIKLYDITSGNVYFKGQRICAGVRSYNDAIKKARAERSAELSALKKAHKKKEDGTYADGKTDEVFGKECEEVRAKYGTVIADQRAARAAAVHDQRFCDKDYSEKLVEEIKSEFKLEEKLAAASGDDERKAVLREYKDQIRIAKRDRIVNRIQMIFQDPIGSLDPRMTVRNIIAEGLVIKGVRDKEYIDKRVFELLERVGLVREHADRYPHEFSGGQRQRIGIARSVIMEPELIIADEPVSALDVSIQAQVINLLNELRNNLGISILFIAHDLSVVKYFSDRIGVMYFGKMVELASSDELFAHPLHPYTKALLSAIPLPDPVYEKNRKRIVYNPIAEHDYSVGKPSLREVAPDHFVSCNDAEFEKYKQELDK